MIAQAKKSKRPIAFSCPISVARVPMRLMALDAR
jgi:hypothetical protein